MRIHNKLFAVLLTSSVLLISIMFALMQWSIDRGMLDYVNTKEAQQLQLIVAALANVYAESNSWQPLQTDRGLLRRLLRDNHVLRLLPKTPPDKRPPPPQAAQHQHRDKWYARYKKARLRNIAVLDQQQRVVVGFIDPQVQRDPNANINRLAIVHQQQTVGWLILPKQREITDGFELQFLQQQRAALFVISLVVIVFTALITLPLARHFVRPIKRLADSTRQLNEGHYQLQLPVDR
ncbi:MAG: hypothetical protein MJA84_06405, partial [Firmicutes bacterium]|nr:hypothetical protein [Bacillota bacterium]